VDNYEGEPTPGQRAVGAGADVMAQHALSPSCDFATADDADFNRDFGTGVGYALAAPHRVGVKSLLIMEFPLTEEHGCFSTRSTSFLNELAMTKRGKSCDHAGRRTAPGWGC
jgi:hypothetical protein